MFSNWANRDKDECGL